jgi:exopolysaccharide biosynthesis polyprenyl glycosylphosphotransferase
VERYRSNDARSTLVLVAGDVLIALLAFAAAFSIRIWVPLPFTLSLLPPERASLLHPSLTVVLATQVPLLYLFGLYDRRQLLRRSGRVSAPAAAAVVQVLIVAAAYFFRRDAFFPRSVLVLFVPLNVAGVVLLRVLVLRRLVGAGRALRIALVGTPRDVADFQTMLRATDPQSRHWQVVTTASVDALDDGGRLAAADDVDEVILVAAESWKDALLGRLLFDGSTLARPRVAVVPTVYDLLVGRLSSLQVADVPLIEVLKDPGDGVAWAVKAALDYVLALLLGVVLAPICLLAMLGIVLTSPGPVLYRQQRVGRRGRTFTIWKLRTMRVDAEADSGPTLADEDDARVIPIGRLLRAARIDEIPQLWNVLNGSMSLVGPRPERPEFALVYQREIPGYGERLLVKPGLTGLAQVRGDYHTPPAYKLKYDLAYIYNYSLLLDLRVLVETVKVLVSRRGV